MAGEDICKLKHDQIEKEQEEQNRRITKHGEELEKIREENVGFKKDIQSLCDQLGLLGKKIDKFTNVVTGTVVTGFIMGLIGLVFYLAQKGLIK